MEPSSPTPLQTSILEASQGLHPDDAADIAALHKALSPEAAPITMDDIWEMTAGHRLVIGRDPETNRIVGMATLVVMRLLRGSRGYVHDVIIAESYRGRGHSKGLMEALIVEAHRLKLASLELTSHDRRAAALNLYETLGFQPRHTNVMILALTTS